MHQLSTIKTIRDKIYHVRGLQVMLDSEISDLYGVDTRSFNQAVKRNIERFPEKFRFQLTEEEFKNLRSQIVILKLKTHRRNCGEKGLVYIVLSNLKSQFVTSRLK